MAVVVRPREEKLQTWFETRWEKLDILEYVAALELRNLSLGDTSAYTISRVLND